jgi:hypothetical protein
MVGATQTLPLPGGGEGWGEGQGKRLRLERRPTVLSYSPEGEGAL